MRKFFRFIDGGDGGFENFWQTCDNFIVTVFFLRASGAKYLFLWCKSDVVKVLFNYHFRRRNKFKDNVKLI